LSVKHLYVKSKDGINGKNHNTEQLRIAKASSVKVDASVSKKDFGNVFK